MHVLVAGAGWLGRAVGAALGARGGRVSAVRRTASGPADLRAAGLEPLAHDLSLRESADRIPSDNEAIVASEAASGDSPDAYRRAYVEVNATLLAAAERLPLRAYVYTSPTGVFGQSDGGDVDETTPAAPASPSAEVLVAAEHAMLEAAAQRRLPTRIVRLSGLYGPGRTGTIDRVRRGALALGPGDDTWMNFCHRDDAVATILALLDAGRRVILRWN